METFESYARGDLWQNFYRVTIEDHHKIVVDPLKRDFGEAKITLTPPLQGSSIFRKRHYELAAYSSILCAAVDNKRHKIELYSLEQAFYRHYCGAINIAEKSPVTSIKITDNTILVGFKNGTINACIFYWEGHSPRIRLLFREICASSPIEAIEAVTAGIMMGKLKIAYVYSGRPESHAKSICRKTFSRIGRQHAWSSTKKSEPVMISCCAGKVNSFLTVSRTKNVHTAPELYKPRELALIMILTPQARQTIYNERDNFDCSNCYVIYDNYSKTQCYNHSSPLPRKQFVNFAATGEHHEYENECAAETERIAFLNKFPYPPSQIDVGFGGKTIKMHPPFFES